MELNYMKKILKFGLVGVGTHARWAVMKAIEETAQNCELVAACDLMEENLKPVAELATGEDGLKAQIVVDEALRQTHENRM
jgi:predicted dehydrogenase